MIRNIEETALWVAVYRARENDRQDALFRDPFAQRLIAGRGEQIAEKLSSQNKNAWAFVIRTFLIDQVIAEQVKQGVDLVLNLAAGMDTRPYRMALPTSLTWIEVDLPELMTCKEEMLGSEKPVCNLQRIHLDLSNVDGRREVFERVGCKASKALIVSEGLIVYLREDEVSALAQDLAALPSFRRWILDLASPGLLRMIQRQVGSQLSQAGATLKFASEEGPGFFTRYGWQPMAVRSMLRAAARAKRVPPWMRLLARLPESKGRQGSRPWSAVCLFARP